jgi:Cof subfamily protein (haloacid dehalogenase superfamily)
VTPPPLRLVATDLDGTIVPWGGEISDRTVRALQAVERQGVPVVFVTGRPPRWMTEVAERTGHTGLAVCANGALVYDLHREEVVEHFPLSVEVGLDLARRLREALPDLGFAVETLDGFAHEPAYVPRWDRVDARLVAPIEDIYAARPVVKLLARHEQLDADALLAKAREVVGDLAELTHSSTTGLLEISAAGVSKATTLARLCEQRGVGADEVVAFGDMPNDLPMLAWAGTAYAMAGGHPDVLAAVQRHALSPEEDGVAAVLEDLFDLRREPVLDP